MSVPPRADGIDAYIVARQIFGERAREIDHTGLGGAVRLIVGMPLQPRLRRGVENHAAAGAAQRRHAVAASKEDAAQIDVDDAVPLRFCECLEGDVLADAGVVEEDVKAAEARHGRLHHGFGVGGTTDVGVDKDRVSPSCPNRRCCIFAHRVLDVGDDDACSFRGEAQCRRSSNAGSGASDQCDLVLQACHVCLTSFRRKRVSPPRHRGHRGHDHRGFLGF